MKNRTILYWLTTGLICGLQSLAAFLYLTSAPVMTQVFAELGYPSYFRTMLGVAKVLGMVVILLPRLGLLKEWAYAGFAITFVSGFVSHLACGHGVSIPPLGALTLLSISYVTRPEERRGCNVPVGTQKVFADSGFPSQTGAKCCPP
jgi:hypothetical protein